QHQDRAFSPGRFGNLFHERWRDSLTTVWPSLLQIANRSQQWCLGQPSSPKRRLTARSWLTKIDCLTSKVTEIIPPSGSALKSACFARQPRTKYRISDRTDKLKISRRPKRKSSAR